MIFINQFNLNKLDEKDTVINRKKFYKKKIHSKSLKEISLKQYFYSIFNPVCKSKEKEFSNKYFVDKEFKKQVFSNYKKKKRSY